MTSRCKGNKSISLVYNLSENRIIVSSTTPEEVGKCLIRNDNVTQYRTHSTDRSCFFNASHSVSHSRMRAVVTIFLCTVNFGHS
jgi:hypothetical protein